MRKAPLLALVALLSCGDNLPGPPETIADHVRQDPRFSTLESALREADLLARLDEPAAATLFAPTDAAFEALYAERGVDRRGLLDLEQLADLIGHHVVDGALSIDDLERRTALLPLGGPEIHVRAGVDGIALDDATRIVAEPIAATNGVIYVLDAVLDRPMITTTRQILVQPDLELSPPTEEDPFGTTSSFVTIEDEGFIHDLRVVVDIETSSVGSLYVFLAHEQSGAFHPLVRRPRSGDDNMHFTFADSAGLDAQDDVFASDGGETEAYAEAAYRPFQPLELFVGGDISGEWQLYVYNVDGRTVGRIREWGLIATYGSEPAAPAIVYARDTDAVTFARGFNETASADIRRVGGLEGEVVIAASAGDLAATPVTLDGDQGAGRVVMPVPVDAELGERELAIAATAGDVSRVRKLTAEVVDPDASGLELVAHVPLPELGGGLEGNDLWGWTDPMTGVEYVLMGTSNGTAFVDISDPASPEMVAFLPTHTVASDWRDIKVFQNHAFIVSEATAHGLQVFDLTELRSASGGQVVAETAYSGAFGNAHNIAIDEASGFAYVVGATEEYPDVCSGGLLMLDVNTPTSPSVVGCFAGGVPPGQSPGPQFPTEAYTHDAQCVVYNGPDVDHQGAQVCFTSDGVSATNDNALAIADVTDKSAVVQLARHTYQDAGYAHQGWLTDDQRYFVLNDEFDEFYTGHTRSYVFDVSDLENPTLHGVFDNPRDAVGHNTFIRGNVAYQANYTSGLRIVDITDIDTMGLAEIAYFDTFPRDDRTDDGVAFRCNAAAASGRHPEADPGGDGGCGREQAYRGAWSNYPYFGSGIIAVSDIDRGLFLFRPTIAMP